jgi:glycosyltransferase involved in cell wall biosynthesis
MKLSVVICTYSEGLYEHLLEAIESVRAQTYDDIESIVVVDGNESLYERLTEAYGDDPTVKLHCNDENVGLSASRNNALEYALGDVVAFLDDDAVADEQWAARLVEAYEEGDVIAAGGRMTPIWVAGKPDFLPEEFYWLVGVTHRGSPEAAQEVRNTFGSNISFRRDILEDLGGFDEDLGRQGDAQIQGEEAALAARMYDEYGKGVWYVPDAEVGHKVFEYRTDRIWLLKRAFWQGYSKRVMDTILEDSGAQESDFLRKLVVEFVPERVGGLLESPSWTRVDQLVMLVVLTVAVGIGFLYGAVRYGGRKA